MKKKFGFTMLIAIMAVVLLAGTALAHTALFSCWDNGDGTVSCEGGYSDGSSAAGTTINVADGGGNVTFSGKLDKFGQLTIKKPAGEYSVTFDGGPGHSVTVNGKDIK